MDEENLTPIITGEETRRRASQIGRDLEAGFHGAGPHTASIVLKLRRRAGLDYTIEIPLTRSSVDEFHREVRRRGPGGEDYLKRWIGERVHEVLGDLGDEGSGGIFSRFEMRTDEVGDGWEVEGFVPRAALVDARPITSSGSDMFDAVRYAASRLVHRTTGGRMGAADEASYWRGLHNDELDRNRALQSELRDLKESPRNRTVEELARALETSDEARRVQEREIGRMESHNEDLLQRNVRLSKRLAEVDPLYRERVERRREGED